MINEPLIRVGPVIVLELCDVTLKDWLTSSSTMSLVDVLEDILIFALNVARAVEFLHSQKVGLTLAIFFKKLCKIAYVKRK